MLVRVVSDRISRDELSRLAAETYKEMIKAAVDVQKEVLAVGGELHADCEARLLDEGSQEKDLWGINIYLEKPESERIEYTSFINVRPSHGNSSMEIKDPRLRKRIGDIVKRRIDWGPGNT